MAITYDKDGAYIEVTEDGVVHRRSIRWEDCVVSTPSNGYEKIDSAYINESGQLVLVLEDESEITVATDIFDLTLYLLADGTRAASEIRLTPKPRASSSGPEGTVLFDSEDKCVYVGIGV